MNPLDYDIYHLGISGGKDSTAAMLWLLYESGWPLDRVLLTFCDTGNEDNFTYNFLDYLREIHPIRTIKPEMDFWELAKFKKRFPSRKARFCTQWLKIIPSREFILDLLKKDKKVLLLTGVRKDEGKPTNNRGNLPQFGWDDGFCCDVFRPIYNWSLNEVWGIHKKYLDLGKVLKIVQSDSDLDTASTRWNELYHTEVNLKAQLISKIQKHQVPRNPLYDLGASRVGCFPCINSNKAEIRAMNKYRPQRVEFLAEKEFETSTVSSVGYSSFFARKTVPLQHRSKEIITKSEVMRVATIYDVVKWATTSYGGKQFDFIFDILDDDEFSLCGIHGECE